MEPETVRRNKEGEENAERLLVCYAASNVAERARPNIRIPLHQSSDCFAEQREPQRFGCVQQRAATELQPPRSNPFKKRGLAQKHNRRSVSGQPRSRIAPLRRGRSFRRMALFEEKRWKNKTYRVGICTRLKKKEVKSDNKISQ